MAMCGSYSMGCATLFDVDGNGRPPDGFRGRDRRGNRRWIGTRIGQLKAAAKD